MHAVVAAEVPPERIMNALKSYASRALHCHRRWARHGSTLYRWTRDEVSSAIAYVISKQGEPMAVYQPTAQPQPNPDRQGGDLLAQPQPNPDRQGGDLLARPQPNPDRQGGDIPTCNSETTE